MPATLEDTRPLTQFRALSTAGKIDVKHGVILGASVITVGPALGHGVTVDEKGLKQCLEACEDFGDEGVKLILDHDSGFQEIVGAVKNFRISGLQLLGDAYLLDNAPSRDHIIELAQKLPRNIGLSVETYGDPEKVDGKKYWRVDSIDAIALVPNPAANPTGLFSRRKPASHVDTTKETNRNPQDMTLDEFKTAFAELVKPLTDEVTALKAKVEDKEEVTKLSTKLDEQKSKLESLPTSDKIGEVIKEKVDAAVKEAAPQIAADAVTKFAAKIGVKQAPDSKTGDDGEGEKKTSFSAKIKKHRDAGAKDDGTAIARAANDDPQGYDEWCKAGRPRE